MEDLEGYIKRDVFDREENKISYVANAVMLEDARYLLKAETYAQQLRESGTLNACVGMAQHYYLAQGEVHEAVICCREGVNQRISEGAAWDVFFAFCRDRVVPAVTEETLDQFVEDVLSVVDDLEEFNRDRIGKVTLSEKSIAFVELLEEIRDQKVPTAEALNQLAMHSAFAQVK